MGADNIRKAEHYVAEAKSTASVSSSKLWSIFAKSSSSNIEKAAELYGNAANLYKLEKMYKEAGDCLFEGGRLMKKAHSGNYSFQAAIEFVNAFNSYKNMIATKPNADSLLVPGSREHMEIVEKATKSLNEAIDIYTSSGKFDNAAKQQLSLAELYEVQLKDYASAVKAYQTAADWFSGENNQSRANAAFLKAAEIYERVGLAYAEERLLRHSAKDHFLKSVLCYIAFDDNLTAKRKLMDFKSVSPGFAESREAKFVNVLTTAIDNNDHEEFSSVVTSYDKMSKIDAWQTKILLHIKQAHGLNAPEPEAQNEALLPSPANNDDEDDDLL